MIRWSRFLSVLLALPVFMASALAEQSGAPIPSSALALEASAEWNKTLALARQEGRLRLSGPKGLEKFKQGLTESFETKFGITVEYVQLSPEQVLQRVREERAAGRYLWDIFIGGQDTLLFNLKSLGVLAPIESAFILPEVKDPKNWQGGKLPFFDRDRLGLFFLYGAGQYFYVNTELARPEEITSYWDLLNPRWKGKILVTRDPRIPGHGRLVFLFFYVHKELGPDFVRKLAQDDLQIPKDDEQAEHWLTQGKYAICFCNNAEATKLANERLPVKLLDPRLVKEGIDVTSSFANVGFADRAPHPNAAKVYINWLLSQEAGTMLSKVTRLASPRVDVTKEFVKPSAVPQLGWPMLKREEMQEEATEMAKLLEELLEKKRP